MSLSEVSPRPAGLRLPARVNRLVGRALHDYAMLADGDRVLVAVSGGVDSLVLTHLLVFWQRKAPVRYRLFPVHVRRDEATAKAAAQATNGAGLELAILEAPVPDLNDEDAESSCYLCARSRRVRLFEAARELRCNKLALGHHRDDLIETFLMNLTCAGNLSTMLPRQDLFGGKLSLIRPLAYVEKSEIEAVAQANGLIPTPSTCPLSGHTRRDAMRELSEEICRRIPGAKRHIFAALGNARTEYLLDGRSVMTM